VGTAELLADAYTETVAAEELVAARNELIPQAYGTARFHIYVQASGWPTAPTVKTVGPQLRNTYVVRGRGQPSIAEPPEKYRPPTKADVGPVLLYSHPEK